MLRRINKPGVSAGVFLLVSLFSSLYGQEHIDTARIQKIGDVIVTERYEAVAVKSVSPTQILTSEELKQLNALQVSDAVKHFAGVTVKDYGGVGGLKTVSLRSLGANHTAVGYDGITLSDNQTGQIDLSRFSLENIEIITLSNGQVDQIFQPARMFALAGVLNLRTKIPVFDEGKTWNASALLKAGSFGLANPYLSVEKRLSRRWSLALNGEWMSANGKYPFTLRYGGGNDSISHEQRTNTQVKMFRTEMSAYGRFSDSDFWRFKAYYYQSSRGLPGAIKFYNSYSSQHLWDRNFFAQSHYRRQLSPSFDFQASGKYNRSKQRYLDPLGPEDNRYCQQEFYLTASLLYNVLPELSFSFSTDGAVNMLSANTYKIPDPRRYSWLSVLAGKYTLGPATFSTSLLATLIKEDADRGGSAGTHRKLSPYAGMSVRILKQEELFVRGFFKKSFRMPSFNDLYYSRTDSLGLKPENADQYNIGVTYFKNTGYRLSGISVTVDAFYNRVDDKIIAYPSKDIFNWSTINLGVVKARGVDVALAANYDMGRGFKLEVSGNYTFQRALDMTDPNEMSKPYATYKDQIAYTPFSSGSANTVLKMPWLDLSYTVVVSGYRYVLGENIPENRLDGYADHSLSASREFKFEKAAARLSVEALNLGGKNYEVVRWYPMPGRSFRVTLSADF